MKSAFSKLSSSFLVRILRTKKDQELLELFLSGDFLAFEVLYERYNDRVYSFLRGLFKDEALAQEVVQESFMKVFEKRENLEQVTYFQAWIFQVAKNLYLDKLKKKDALNFLSYSEEDYEQRSIELTNPESLSLEKHQKEVVQNCLQKLSDKQKEVLLLRIHGELKLEDIANQLEISLGAVKSTLLRAKKSLIQCCQECQRKGPHE